MSGQRWDVVSIREYQVNGQTKTSWTKVGAAFTNKNGSINVQLDAIPLDGRLQLQTPLSREEREAKRQNYQNQRGGSAGGQQQRYRPQSQPKPLGNENMFGKSGQQQDYDGGGQSDDEAPY